jgi:hypothetical protein
VIRNHKFGSFRQATNACFVATSQNVSCSASGRASSNQFPRDTPSLSGQTVSEGGLCGSEHSPHRRRRECSEGHFLQLFREQRRTCLNTRRSPIYRYLSIPFSSAGRECIRSSEASLPVLSLGTADDRNSSTPITRDFRCRGSGNPARHRAKNCGGHTRLG